MLQGRHQFLRQSKRSWSKTFSYFPCMKDSFGKENNVEAEPLFKVENIFLNQQHNFKSKTKTLSQKPPIHKLFLSTSGIISSLRMSAAVSSELCRSGGKRGLPRGRSQLQAGFHKKWAPPQITATGSSGQGETAQAFVQMHFLGA